MKKRGKSQTINERLNYYIEKITTAQGNSQLLGNLMIDMEKEFDIPILRCSQATWDADHASDILEVYQKISNLQNL